MVEITIKDDQKCEKYECLRSSDSCVFIVHKCVSYHQFGRHDLLRFEIKLESSERNKSDSELAKLFVLPGILGLKH